MPCRPPTDRLRNFPVAAVLMAAVTVTGCDDFREKQTESPPAPRQSIAQGQKLLSQYQCGSCHAIPGVMASHGQVTSSLEAWGGRSYIAGRHANRPDLLAQWIVQPQSLVPGTLMPSMGVSPEDARHMAAYLMSLE